MVEGTRLMIEVEVLEKLACSRRKREGLCSGYLQSSILMSEKGGEDKVFVFRREEEDSKEKRQNKVVGESNELGSEEAFYMSLWGVLNSKQVEEEIVQQEDVVAEQVMIESSKKARGRLKRKVSNARKDKDKRQKMQDNLEKLTLKEYVEVISDSEEVISVILLAVKSLIVSWKSYCKGDVGYYKIHWADRSYKTYIFFSEMLNDFDREDLIVLYRILNEKFTSTRPGFDDLMLWGDLKIMFEPDSDDEVWKNHQHQELIEWKLYDSCEVHSLMLGEVSIHMLVEKKYPLPQDTLTRMLQWKLHVNNDVTDMAYELLRFIRSQLQK
ncbi:hypothetical protein Tco_0609034 [Tanacetum coccineum]